MRDRTNGRWKIGVMDRSALALGEHKPVDEDGKACAVGGRDGAAVHFEHWSAACGEELRARRTGAPRRDKGERTADLNLARSQIRHLHRVGHVRQPLAAGLPPFSIRSMTSSMPF
jgi:hypothetical protein